MKRGTRETMKRSPPVSDESRSGEERAGPCNQCHVTQGKVPIDSILTADGAVLAVLLESTSAPSRVSAHRTSIRLRSTTTSASSTRPPKSARSPVVKPGLIDRDFTSLADGDTSQLETNPRQQSWHRRTDRDRAAKRRRRLRFDRGLDAIAPEKDAHRQR